MNARPILDRIALLEGKAMNALRAARARGDRKSAAQWRQKRKALVELRDVMAIREAVRSQAE